jgi:hypothetical protein
MSTTTTTVDVSLQTLTGPGAAVVCTLIACFTLLLAMFLRWLFK